MCIGRKIWNLDIVDGIQAESIICLSIHRTLLNNYSAEILMKIFCVNITYVFLDKMAYSHWL